MRNEKLDLLVTFDKTTIEPFKGNAGLCKILYFSIFVESKTVEVKKPIVFRYYTNII